ncbi:MAG: MFS superfamily sulfate permease-like transporter [Hyphomicrobiaceae bacterium]|jgi:MFS superfamily sulfate permease-like transporter
MTATTSTTPGSLQSLIRDLSASLVVFLVALPLCLGIALASNAPLFSGLVAGIVGGIIVGALSGSSTSVSGPAAGLTAIVAAQISALGSFEAFLFAVVLAGMIQVCLGVAQAGFIASYFPSSVIKGLLAAIGTILILKQIPHLFGHDADPEGEMSFFQPDHETTFSELAAVFDNLHPGASLIGLACLALLIFWERSPALKKLSVPAPLVVVLLGSALAGLLSFIGEEWAIGAQHLVQVPAAESFAGFLNFFTTPDFSVWSNPVLYSAAITIALVASLETLLNLEAVDKIDPRQRSSPASRELVAQGIGNITSGMLGGLPVTSVIVRSSVNVSTGAETKLSAIFHGVLLLGCVGLLPTMLNRIPLSCLAAILLVTGFKLASPKLIRQLWNEGVYQFSPFIITVVAIVLTDLLVGIMIGLLVSVSFILYSNFRVPIRRVVEKHVGDEVVHVQLSDQVSFLKRAALLKVLNEVPEGGHILLDAQNTDFIDPDILDLLQDYTEITAPARNIEVSLLGFKKRYNLEDRIQFVDYSSRDLQSAMSPQDALQVLKEGHARFRSGNRLLSRNLGRQIDATAASQHPIGAILACIDSRVPTELVFDAGVGDIFSVRVAGNVSSRKILGSLEYACGVAGAKVIVVMGHTYCGAVSAAVNLAHSGQTAKEATGCDHVQHIIDGLTPSIDMAGVRALDNATAEEKEAFINLTARKNVQRTMQILVESSSTLSKLQTEGKVLIVGAMYDVRTGDLEFLADT